MHIKDLVEESVIHVTSALVGNWLSTLTFKSTASVSDTALTRITIISEIDASVFFYIELPLDEATALIECLQQLSTAIAEDSSNLSVRIELGKTTAMLVLDICDGPKRFLLTRPTTTEMNNHLLLTLSRNRLKQQAVWNEKELELMKLLVRSSSAGFQPDITMKNVHMRSENGVDTHCKSCNCHTLNKKIPEKSMLDNQKGNMDGRAMEMDAQENVMVEPDSRRSDEMKMLTVKHNLNRDASTELNSNIGPTSSQSQDLLLGMVKEFTLYLDFKCSSLNTVI
uniref:Checkpoint protein n=1 Tax=Heterorhabditis bacteriophora TaxID=37862 RepID=A0A1I7XGU1_HETBA